MRESSDVMIVLGALLAAAIFATGQDTRSGWKLKPGGEPDMVRFTVERYKLNGHWSSTRDVPLADFHGLSQDARKHGGRVKFEYVQDAGRLLCTGSFSSFIPWSSGSGTFQFVTNPEFVAELSRLGYSAPNEDQLFSMMMSNVSLAFARGVSEAGLRASTDQLLELRNHGVTLDFIGEARQARYTNFLAKDFIELRIHGVTGAFLRDLKDYGYNLSTPSIVELRIQGVTAEFMDDLKKAGYNLTSIQIVELKIHGVDSNYIRELKSYGLQPRPSDLVQFKIHGVTPDYLRGLKDAGYGGLSEGQITELKIHGVSADFMQEASNLGYHFSAQDLTELKIHGVDGAYLKRLKDSGIRDLPASQITKLKIHGVD